MKQEIFEETSENKKNLYYYKQVMNPYPVEEYSYTAYEKGFIEGYQESTKWQQERSFSEEEVIDIFFLGRESLNKPLITKEEALEVIKQFKMK